MSKYFRKHSEGEKVIKEWVDYSLEFGIEHLIVKNYFDMSFIAYYNIDVWFVMIGLIVGCFIFIIRFLF